MRMNTASEKVLRRRSARGPILLYDLRFRRNTVHCVAKFGCLLGRHALKTLLPGLETHSVAITNGPLDASYRDILSVCKIQGRRRAVGAQNCRIMFSK